MAWPQQYQETELANPSCLVVQSGIVSKGSHPQLLQINTEIASQQGSPWYLICNLILLPHPHTIETYGITLSCPILSCVMCHRSNLFILLVLRPQINSKIHKVRDVCLFCLCLSTEILEQHGDAIQKNILNEQTSNQIHYFLKIVCKLKISNLVGQWWCAPLIAALGRQRQVSLPLDHFLGLRNGLPTFVSYTV